MDKIVDGQDISRMSDRDLLIMTLTHISHLREEVKVIYSRIDNLESQNERDFDRAHTRIDTLETRVTTIAGTVNQIEGARTEAARSGGIAGGAAGGIISGAIALIAYLKGMI